MANRITISVLNRSDKTIVTDAALKDFVDNALQPQVSEHFLPAWNVDAQVTFAQNPLPGSWWLVVLDRTDQSNWFGYHLTEDGLPFAKVFAQTIDRRGCSWTVSVSHELLEMLAKWIAATPSADPGQGEKAAGEIAFADFHRVCVYRYYDVDKELNDLCAQVIEVAAPMNTLLMAIQ